MIDFFIHEYNETESITEGIVAPHKYRHPLYKNSKHQKTIIKAWNNDKNKIAGRFIIELKKYYGTDEAFLLFTPATITRFFIDDIIRMIKQEFLNVIDLTNIFCKKEKLNFGDAEFDKYTNGQLAEYIIVDIDTLKSIDEKIEKAFIIDDVYSSGKSMELTKYLIVKNFNRELNIKNGAILRITKERIPQLNKNALMDIIKKKKIEINQKQQPINEIIRNRTIRPSTRLEKSKNYKIDTKRVSSGDILVVNIKHESKSFNMTYKFKGIDVAHIDSISFTVKDFENSIDINWISVQPI